MRASAMARAASTRSRGEPGWAPAAARARQAARYPCAPVLAGAAPRAREQLPRRGEPCLCGGLLAGRRRGLAHAPMLVGAPLVLDGEAEARRWSGGSRPGARRGPRARGAVRGTPPPPAGRAAPTPRRLLVERRQHEPRRRAGRGSIRRPRPRSRARSRGDPTLDADSRGRVRRCRRAGLEGRGRTSPAVCSLRAGSFARSRSASAASAGRRRVQRSPGRAQAREISRQSPTGSARGNGGAPARSS